MEITNEKLDKDLDALEKECVLLLSLLRDRRPGLVTWRGFVGDRAQAINAMFKAMGMVE